MVKFCLFLLMLVFLVNANNEAPYKLLRKLSSKGRVTHLQNLNDGRFVIGTYTGRLMFYNNIGDLTNDVQAHTSEITDLIRLKSGWIVSAGVVDIKIWDENGNFIKNLFGIHIPPIKNIVELSNGYIASYGEDYIIKVWDPKTLNVIHNLKGHSSRIFKVLDLSDGTIVSGSDDLTIKFWRNETCFKTIFVERTSQWPQNLFKLSPNRFASIFPTIIYDENGNIKWNRTETEMNEPILQVGNEFVIKDRTGKISFYNDKGEITNSFAYPYRLERIYFFNDGFIFVYQNMMIYYTKSGQRIWIFQNRGMIPFILNDDRFMLTSSSPQQVPVELYVRK